MGFNIMDLMNGATRAAVEGVDNYEAITLNLDEIKVTKHNRYSIRPRGPCRRLQLQKAKWDFMSRKPENTPWKRIWKALWLHRKPLRLQTIIL